MCGLGGYNKGSGWLSSDYCPAQALINRVRLPTHITYVLCYKIVLMFYNVLYMKRSHARTSQLSNKLSGYVLYTVLVAVLYLERI